MNKKLREFTIVAMIAAIYAVTSIALAPISYGPIQVRVSEALTLLPLIYPPSIIGVTLGCFVTNLVGAMTGMNILGFVDVFVGTLATFMAAWCTYKLRNVQVKGLPLLSASMPVIFNAVFIGLELAIAFYPATLMVGFITSAFQVGLGELIACFVLGIPLINLLKKTKLFDEKA